RLKFLLNKVGFDEFLEMVEEERIASKVKTYKIDRDTIASPSIPEAIIPDVEIPANKKLAYELWLATNVFKQKQEGFNGVFIKARTGDMSTAVAREFVA